MALPLGLKGRDVDDDAAARVSRLAEADGEHVARDAEEFHRASEGERVGRDDAYLAAVVDEVLLVEGLRVDDGGIDVGEDLEFGRAADVVAVARGAVGPPPAAADLLHLSRLEGLDHAVFGGHAADPLV